MTSRWTFTAFILLTFHQAQAANLKSVRVDFIEALSLKDTTSSERFQKDYQDAIQLGKNLIAAKVAKCGYSIEAKASFYESGDALRAKELAEESRKNGSWMIVGPRRSNQYLLLVQGAKTTPTVSLMASSDDVSKLGPRHISISPTNSQMARLAAQEASVRKKGGTYLTIVSDDCSNCVDFSQAFDHAARRLDLRKLAETKIVGETFSTQPILESSREHKPDFILLPNYSIVANRIMNAFNGQSKSPLFIGGDGWGDSRYGFVQNGQKLDDTIRGLTVRGFPPVEHELKRFELGLIALAKKREIPFSAANSALLKIVDSLGEMLCKKRPQNGEAFEKDFDKYSKRLSAPWGVSVYELRSGELKFLKSQVVR